MAYVIRSKIEKRQYKAADSTNIVEIDVRCSPYSSPKMALPAARWVHMRKTINRVSRMLRESDRAK